MTVLVPNGASVTVTRGGKRIKVAPGTAFDFTDAEIASVKKGGAGTLRVPVNEIAAPVADEDEDSGKKAPKAKGGKKAAVGKKAAKPESQPETEGDDDADEDGDDDEDI